MKATSVVEAGVILSGILVHRRGPNTMVPMRSVLPIWSGVKNGRALEFVERGSVHDGDGIFSFYPQKLLVNARTYSSRSSPHHLPTGYHTLSPLPVRSPIYEFRAYAERTTETFLIAAVGVAAALSTKEGTRPYETLAGWSEPFPMEVTVANRTPPMNMKPQAAVGRREVNGGDGGGNDSIIGEDAEGKGLSVPLEEASSFR